ncbi:MAG: glutathione S-transferase family protein [Gammaproteobacteria bacterium]|nr:glutathione S-transferase family protein [Gammaproteobacteria bacterium]
MYTLHIANKNYSSWSLRPWALLRQLGIPFDEKLSVFGEGSNYDEFREFAPNGLVPCLIDGDTTVWDSLAIIEYVAEDHPAVWPADKVARAWARSASAEMHSGFSTLRNHCPMNCGLRVAIKQISPRLQRDIDRIDELWNEGLSRFGGPFLAGQKFTAVDAYYAPVAYRIRGFALSVSEPVAAYVERLLATDALLEWERAAIAEPWRELAHEAEALQYGELVKDYRST